MCKRVISLLLTMAMLLGALPSYASEQTSSEQEGQIPSFDAETLIEFEYGCIESKTAYITESRTASNLTVVTPGGTCLSPNKDTTPDITYMINIPEDGTYTLYTRYCAPNVSSDSFHMRWDDKNYVSVNTGTTSGWAWGNFASTYLSAGQHKLSILRREPGFIWDAFVVTKNSATVDIEAIEHQIALEAAQNKSPQFAVNSDAPTIDLKDGFGIIEAENARITENMFSIGNDISSGIKYVSPIYKEEYMGITPDKSLTGLEFNFNIDEPAGIYSVWVRTRINTDGEDSMYVSLDGGEYESAMNYKEGVKVNGVASYEWRKIAVFGYCQEGSKHNVRFFPREGGSRIDKILLTSRSAAVPVGINGELQIMTELDSARYPVPTVVPPANQHPRIYFTQKDISKIKENIDKTQNAVYKSYYETALAKDEDGDLGIPILDSYTNYNENVAETIEAYAFEYAVYGDESYGYKATTAIKNLLRTATFDMSQEDISRQIGHTIFLASQVYDWCYDLFTDKEREYIIAKCEDLASQMEMGWPPRNLSSITSHAGEAMLMRDLLGFAIATYDERPDIYNYIGGRFFSEYIDARNYMYESSSHNQGDAYGNYRYYWEMMAQVLISSMTDGEIRPFNDTQGDVPYYWIYTRRPDGQLFRTGDCTIEGTENSSYWNSHVDMMFIASNFYGDSYLKGQYYIENPSDTPARGLKGRTAVFQIIYNDPDLEGIKDKTALPLSKYFGSPYGMMIARTGWDVDDKNPGQVDDVVAMMKIRELWGTNHDHFDSGHFQIYYKGILASESGYYDYYGSYQDHNYNKASVAHNVLTIYDPNEKFAYYNGPDQYGNQALLQYGANDGGQRRIADVAITMDSWIAEENGYKTGVVLDHAFGPDKITPEYTYIRGDITKAYSSDKVDNVMRAMAFMPLEDENYPAIMVVFDKVKSTNASFKKKWLLHTQREPQVTQNGAIIKNDVNGYNGKLTLQTLLPKLKTITKVGGDGYRFWIGNQSGDFLNDGRNFDTDPALPYDTALEAGWGRIEISPLFENLEDKFLNVMAVSDADNTAAPLESTLIEGTKLTGVKTSNKVIMFADTDTSVSDKNRVLDSASFTIPSTEGTLDIMIAGMKAGVWSVNDVTSSRQFEVSEEEGTLYFEGKSGTYTLEYVGSVYAASIPKISINDDKKTKTVSVDVENPQQGAILMMVVTDSEGSLIYTASQKCTEQTNYEFSLKKAFLPKGKVNIQAFLWDSLMSMKPIATSKLRTVTKEGTN